MVSALKTDTPFMRQAEWELQRYERLKPMIVEVIKAHGAYAIFKLNSGELKLWKSFEEFWKYERECGLDGIPRVRVEPRDDAFRIQLESEESVIKQEFYRHNKFEADFEYIIEDHPELQFSAEVLADALLKALNKAKRAG